MTVDRIEGVSIRSLPTILLIDSAEESTSPNQFQWASLEFPDGSIMGGFELVVGATGFAWFVVPEEATPKTLFFTYVAPQTSEETDKPTKRWRRRKRPKQVSRTLEIALPAKSPGLPQ